MLILFQFTNVLYSKMLNDSTSNAAFCYLKYLMIMDNTENKH